VTATELAARFNDFASRLTSIEAHIERLTSVDEGEHDRVIHALRITRDNDTAARAALWELRGATDYRLSFEEPNPLVSIIVPASRNLDHLRDRTLPALLSQSHEQFEAIVVADEAQAEIEDLVLSLRDPRLRFVNFPYRGPYPEDPRAARLVSGVATFNTGLALAKGRWIGSSSADDALHPDCIETLLALARNRRSEVAYGQVARHDQNGEVTLVGAFPPRSGQWRVQCSLIHTGLRFLSLQPTDWLFGVSKDWSLAERMLRIGVYFSMLEEPVLDYYPSRT
jgi:hypothetical protein